MGFEFICGCLVVLCEDGGGYCYGGFDVVYKIILYFKLDFVFVY